MRRAILMALGVGLLTSGGVAQDQPKGALKSDFVIVIKELDAAACKKMGLKATEFTSGAGELTRDELIAQLSGLLEKYQAKFRITPRPYDVYPEVIDKFNKSQATRDQLRKLSKWGVIGPVSPIVTNKGASISEQELGDALGYFYAQVVIYAHQPDPKFTPALLGGE